MRQHHIAGGLRRLPGWQHTLIPGGASSGVAVTVPSSRYKSLATKRGAQQEKAAIAMWVLLCVCVCDERVPNRAEPLEIQAYAALFNKKNPKPASGRVRVNL